MVDKGDLLHGDANGVTSVPIDIASDVADAAAEFVESENLIMDYVKNDGEKSVIEFRERTKAFKQAIEDLKGRIQSRA